MLAGDNHNEDKCHDDEDMEDNGEKVTITAVTMTRPNLPARDIRVGCMGIIIMRTMRMMMMIIMTVRMGMMMVKK